MNNPEFYMVDEIGTLIADAGTNLGIAINYQYGYLMELQNTLKEYSKTVEYSSKKYPLVWLVQPFSINRKDVTYYGDTTLRLFIIQESEKGLKASERMAQTFKPVIYPIYRELLKQITNNGVLFDGLMGDHVPHTVTDRYYWGEDQQNIINDVFDCLEISNMRLKISNKQNCSIN
jgi:hypothetical protein